MTLLERVRVTFEAPTPGERHRPGSVVHGALAALAAAVVSLVLICLPVAAAWGATSAEESPWTAAAAVGGHAWLVGHFVRLEIAGQTLSLTPLLLAAVPLLVACSAARRVVSHSWAPAIGFVSGYAACVLLVSGMTWPGPAGAEMASAVLAAVAFPSVAYLLAAARAGVLSGPGTARRAPRWWGVTVVTVRRAASPAGWGVAALMVAGTFVVLVQVGLSAGRVAAVYGELRTGVFGAVVLTLAQVLALPNLAIWAVSFLAGPGVSLGAGQTLTHQSAEGSVLPMVPAFAAVPPPGPLPSWLWVGALVPVLVGAVVGWRSAGQHTRLSARGVKVRTAFAACLMCAAAMGALAWLSSGGLGASMLQDVGAAAGAVTAYLTGLLVLGALPAVLVAHRRARRR